MDLTEAGKVRTGAKRLAKRVIRRGNRTILTTPVWVRFGNLLYLWLHAFIEQEHGRDLRVLANDAALPWLSELPRIRNELTVDVEQMRIWDRRQWPDLRQRFGIDFEQGELEDFIRTMLIPSPLLGDLPFLEDHGVVVNIRRGDYYSHPDHRANYGFDILPYLKDALLAAGARRTVTGIYVVSDDIQWCRKNLDALLCSFAPVSYAGDSRPKEDFRALCTARTLVCANSTFSYWGGYVSSVVHGPESHVIAPDLHARHIVGVAPQLDPRWEVVKVVR